MSSKIFIFGFCLLVVESLFCQEPVVPANDIEDLIEAVAESVEENPDHSQIKEDLLYFSNHPLNINAATKEELSQLHLLNPFQIESLQSYIRKNGPMLSVYELPLVFGFSKDMALKLKPFVAFKQDYSEKSFSDWEFKDVIRYGKHQLMVRSERLLETQEGYREVSDSILEIKPNSKYLGSPFKLYSQYRLRYRNRFAAGITLEKDPGERIFSGSNRYGFDFNSFHLFLSQNKWFDRLVIGDYKVRYGQGLVTWSGFTLGKSPMVLNNMKNFHRIDPYTSSNENKYFRGIAIEKKIGKIRGSFFYSNKFRDANIVDLPESNKLTVSSFQQTGYHRLPRELKDEDALRENVYGGSLSLNKPLFRVSLNGLHCAYDGSLLQGSKPYQFFRFSGNSNTTFSLDYRLSLNRFYIFGEEAFSANGGKAFLNGIYGQLSSGLGMVLLHRKYDKNFHSFFAGAFSENTKPQNETGLYGGLQINVLPALTFKGYLDVYRFPWLNYLVDAPSEGWEGLMNLEYTFGEESSMYFRFRRSQDMKNYREEEEKISRLIEKKKTKLRYHLKYRLNRHLILKNRVETVFTRLQNFTSGFMMYQDVSYRPKNNPFSVDFRYAVFDIEDYENRIYAYENDLLYVFSVPAYYGRGSRIYINIKYQLGNMDFWLKLSRTDYRDRESIGSGLNAIDGHTKTRAKLMMRFTF